MLRWLFNLCLCSILAYSATTTTTILPRDIPFVAQLIRFYETAFAYYLLIEVAAGGLLFDHLAPFMMHSANGE